jgi:hypothetical protein
MAMMIFEALTVLPSAAPDGNIIISPAWAGVALSFGTSIIAAVLWISHRLFPSHSDLQDARDECRERHAENRASVDAMDKMIRAEFAGQIAESNRAVMNEFGKLANKVEKLLIRTAVLQDRTSHSDSEETRFPL